MWYTKSIHLEGVWGKGKMGEFETKDRKDRSEIHPVVSNSL